VRHRSREYIPAFCDAASEGVRILERGANCPAEAACVFRLYLLGGICRYIFTVTGSASLKLRVDSAGRTISFSPV
jgi:hypothetical protein